MPVPSDWFHELSIRVNELRLDENRYLRDDVFNDFVLIEHADSWVSFLAWLEELQGSWGFRGQREASWTLRTSLERAVRVEYSRGNCSGVYHLDRRKEERELLFRFRQQAHHYVRHLPHDDDLVSWFALMQHYRVPTRMLDWTRSPYVGMYFAVEEEPVEMWSAIWAIDLAWLERKQRELLGSDHLNSPNDSETERKYLNALLNQDKVPLVARIDPPQANERMFAQQGFFLWKLLEKTPFFDQILMTMMIHPELPKEPVIRKLEIDKKQRIGFLKRLRTMNIHRASLFPGLDGFAQTLKLDLEIKVRDECIAANPPPLTS